MTDIPAFAPERSDLSQHTFWLAQSRARQGYYVINGYNITQNDTPDLDIKIDAGWCCVAGVLKQQSSGTTITMVHDDTNPLISVIYVDSAGALQKYDGTAAAASDPLGASDWHQYVSPYVGASIPDGVILALVYVDAAETTVLNADIWSLAQYGKGLANGETPSGTMNGSNKTFTLAHSPIGEEIRLYQTGGLRMRPTTEYSVSGNTITLVDFAPNAASGDYLLADYEF